MKGYAVGVVGASGRLGGIVAKEASRSGLAARPLPARRLQADAGTRGRANPFEALDVAIFSAPLASSSLHRLALEAGCHVIDVGVAERVVEQSLALHDLAVERDLVLAVMAGLAPGLSGLLGLDAARRFPSARRVDVVLLQCAEGTAGAQGVRDMLDTLTDRERSSIVRMSSRQRTTIGLPDRFVFELPTPERDLLSQGEEGRPEIRYLTAFDASATNWQVRALRCLRRVSEGGYRRVRDREASIKSRRAPPADESMCLIACVGGGEESEPRAERLALISDYGATARVALTLADMAVNRELVPGAGHPSSFTDWPTLRARAFPAPGASAGLDPSTRGPVHPSRGSVG